MESTQVKMGRPILYDDKEHIRMRDWAKRKRESIKYGVPMQKPASKKVALVCKHCGEPFSQWRGNLKKHQTSGKYCSRKCRDESRAGSRASVLCEYCGKEFQVLECIRRNGKGKYCSPQCGRDGRASAVSGNNNCNWNGGTWLSPQGYRIVNIGPGKTEREHRVVMEAILGRELSKDEIVHHKNGDKADNSPENLEVMTRADHVRHHDPRGRRKEDTA